MTWVRCFTYFPKMWVSLTTFLACDHFLHSCQLQRSNEVSKVIPPRAFFSTPSRLEEIQEEGSCGCPESWTQARANKLGKSLTRASCCNSSAAFQRRLNEFLLLFQESQPTRRDRKAYFQLSITPSLSMQRLFRTLDAFQRRIFFSECSAENVSETESFSAKIILHRTEILATRTFHRW